VRISLIRAAGDALTLTALKAARASYAPYTKSPSGAALSTSNGRVFAGSYIENAAFNPSLPPLEAALAGYFAAGRNAGVIQRAVLVEKAGGQISHQVTTKSVLAAIAPSAQLDFTLGTA
jgi:cytidine deaminase